MTTSAYPASFNLAGSGIAAAFHPTGRTRNILIIGDEAMHLSGGTMQAFRRLTTNLCGMVLPGILNSGVNEPATAVTDVVTNLTIGSTLWPYRHDGENAGSNNPSAYIFDTANTAGDGTTAGIDAFTELPAGFQEIIWPQSASAPGAAQRFAKWTLASVSGNDAWLTDHQLTITPFMYVPAADASGTKPIDGGPTLSMGVSRGVAAPTIAGAFTAAATGAIVAGTSATLAAGAGMPVVGLYWPTSAANSKRRAIIPGIAVVNNQPEGVRLVFSATPYSCLSNWDGATQPTRFPSLKPLMTALGGVNAAVVWLGHELEAAFSGNWAFADFIIDLTDPGSVTDDVGIWNEVQRDITDSARHAEHFDDDTLPFLFIVPVFAGQGATLTEWETCLAHMLRQSHFLCTNTSTPPNNHKWTAERCAYIDLGSQWTATQVMTGGLITKGGTTVKGTWSAVTAYVAGDIVNSPNAADPVDSGLKYERSGCGPGSHNWFVSKTSNANKEPGVAADWATHWDKLDFRPTAAFAAAQVQFVLDTIAAVADASSSSSSGAGSRGVRAQRVRRSQR